MGGDYMATDYLTRKFKGKFRVRAEYDHDTGDFFRDSEGNLEESFCDFYINGKNGIKIVHGHRDVLGCYIPSKARGMNILRQIYSDNIDKKVPNNAKEKYLDTICKALVDNKVLVSCEVLDFEAVFEFKAAMIDYIDSLVGLETKGSNIPPFSTKNLPKTKYTIPEDDLKLYDDAIKHLPKKEVVVKDKTRVMVDGLLIKNLNLEFDKVITKSQPKGFDINADRKLKGLNGKNYIHSFGPEMWNKYCEFLSKK